MGAFRTRPHWNYAEIRPIPLHLFNAVLDGADESITTDCSGLATCCYFRAGAPDPNGKGYDTSQTMFTGTMLDHLPHIPLSKAHPGDLAVFGTGTGKHVVIIIGEGSDPTCISHGKQGDPEMAPLSNFAGLGPLTVLRGVPRLFHRKPRLKPKHRVFGDGDRHIGTVYTTRFLWQLRHHRICKGQRNQLDFRRI